MKKIKLNLLKSSKGFIKDLVTVCGIFMPYLAISALYPSAKKLLLIFKYPFKIMLSLSETMCDLFDRLIFTNLEMHEAILIVMFISIILVTIKTVADMIRNN